MKKIIVNVPMTEEEWDARQKAREVYQEELIAWQEEHDVIARTLYENMCQINDISYLEEIVRNYILPYKVKLEYPFHDIEVSRRKFGEHTYQLWITKREHFPVGIVEVAFHNENDAIVKVIIGSSTPSFEELYEPALVMLKGLAEELKKLYGSGWSGSDAEEQKPEDDDLDEKEAVKIILDSIDKAAEVLEKERHRRESTPYMKPIEIRLRKMYESKYVIDRAILAGIPYPNIYVMAKALEKELINSSSLLDAEPEIQKGRYRLTDEDIKYRKKRVTEAKDLKIADPMKTWKEIAKEIDIPERTLRDWRHNPIYN